MTSFFVSFCGLFWYFFVCFCGYYIITIYLNLSMKTFGLFCVPVLLCLICGVFEVCDVRFDRKKAWDVCMIVCVIFLFECFLYVCVCLN